MYKLLFENKWMMLKKFFIFFFLCCVTDLLGFQNPVGLCESDTLILPGFENPAGLNARPRVGLILSGGGAKGIAHVGALKVIEELGIPIDYIGGTSMGSIVGGLYALGYTSVQLENFVREADWTNLLTDRVLRQHVSIYEKSERKRYWLQFPIKDRKIELPLGILSGQNVSNLFTELASSAYAQPDFSKFTIPFLCVATDIETGAEVVLEQGNLVKAMRASMAIPSVFTPELIDGKRLYDGGLVNNFPANLVRDKGIDILIGVDVSSQDRTREITNIYQVMEQVVFMSSLPLNEANKKLCRVLIIPEINEYSASSFNAADSLILRGERAARRKYDELKALAVMLQSFETDKSEKWTDCPQPLPSFYVKEVQINGLKYISKELFLHKLDLFFPTELTFSQLNKALEKVKGTQVFHSIVYHLNPIHGEAEHTDSGIPVVELHFDCVEKRANMFKVGLLYDQEYKAALLLNLSMRNALLNNSKANAELSIGANPAFSLSFLHTPSFQLRRKTVADPLPPFIKSRPSPDWLFYVNGNRFDAYYYSENQRTIAYTFSNLSAGLQLLFSPSNNYAFGAGMYGDYSLMKTYIGQRSGDFKSENLYLTYQTFYERDTYNEDYFPTSGGKFKFEATYHKGLSQDIRQLKGFPCVTFRSNFVVKSVDRWSLHTGIDAGAIFGVNVPLHYMMRLGGAPSKHLYNHFTFIGLHFLQKYNENAWVAHLNNQVRLWNNVYVTLRTNVGKTDQDLIELITIRNFLVGCGVSVQYNTVVGPLGFTVSTSNITKSTLGAINFGFWF